MVVQNDDGIFLDRVCASARRASASHEIFAALVSDADLHLQPLQLIVERAAELADAEQVIVLVPVDPDQPRGDVDQLMVSAAVGVHANELLGQEVPVSGSSAGEVFRSGEPPITDTFRHPMQAFADVGKRPAIVMLLGSGQQALGVMVVVRNAGAPPFGDEYFDLARDFADYAAIALTLATARRHASEQNVLADRDRIAHDLHDHVIQRVFAIGMDLQGVTARLRSPQLAARVAQSVDGLDAVIDDIRRSVFKLQRPTAGRRSFAQRIQDAVEHLGDDHGEVTTLSMAGPMATVSDELADRAEVVVVEVLRNMVWQSGAANITVEVSVTDELLIEINGDGSGIPLDDQRRIGLANVAQCAEDLGGQCMIASRPDGGIHVCWRNPLQDSYLHTTAVATI